MVPLGVPKLTVTSALRLALVLVVTGLAFWHVATGTGACAPSAVACVTASAESPHPPADHSEGAEALSDHQSHSGAFVLLVGVLVLPSQAWRPARRSFRAQSMRTPSYLSRRVTVLRVLLT